MHRPDLALESLDPPRAHAPAEQDPDRIVGLAAGRFASPRARASHVQRGPWPKPVLACHLHRPPNPALQLTGAKSIAVSAYQRLLTNNPRSTWRADRPQLSSALCGEGKPMI